MDSAFRHYFFTLEPIAVNSDKHLITNTTLQKGDASTVHSCGEIQSDIAREVFLVWSIPTMPDLPLSRSSLALSISALVKFKP